MMSTPSDQDTKDYGYVTVGTGTSTPRKVRIESFVRSVWNDNRFAQCVHLEDDTYCIAIENLESSGRNPTNAMRLSKDSFIALMVNIHLYAEVAGIDLVGMAKDALQGDNIQYTVSDNLKPLHEKQP